MTDNEARLQQAASRVQGRMSERLGELWLGFLLRGLLALALGIGALFWPGKTVDLLVQLVGIFAILNGAAGLFSAYQARMPDSYRIPGWLSLVAGTVLLIWPGVSVRLLFIILGIWATFQGASLWLMARQAAAGDPDRGLLSGVGVTAVLAGLVLIFWPGTGAVAISWVIAVMALLAGFSLLYMALHLQRASQGAGNLKR